jgi:hypothetical protein
MRAAVFSSMSTRTERDGTRRISNAEAQHRFRIRDKLCRRSYKMDADDRVVEMLVRHRYLLPNERDDKVAVGDALTLFAADCERDDPMK